MKTSINISRNDEKRHQRTIIALLAAIAVLLPTTLASAIPQPTTQKTGTALRTGSNTQVESDDQVDWVVKTADVETRDVSAVVTDSIGEGHGLVPGSVKFPSNWTALYSDQSSGEDFTAAESSATRRIRISSGDGQPSGLLGGVDDLLSNQPAFTEGDGWLPLFQGSRIFNVFHHTGTNKPELNCTDRQTRAVCAGYPKEISISTPNDLFTPFSAAATIDSAGRLWFSGTHQFGSSAEGGFACFDTIANAPCLQSWFPVAQNLVAGTAYVSRSPFSGVSVLGTKLFALAVNPTSGPNANQINLHCFNTATLSNCGTTNLNPGGLPGWNNSFYAQGRSPALNMRQVGDRVYIIVDYASNPGVTSGLGNRLFCADLTTGASCEGWTVPAIPGTTDGGGLRFSNTIFPDLNNLSNICVANTLVNLTLLGTSPTRTLTCFDQAGLNTPSPAGLQAAMSSVPLQIPIFGGAPTFAGNAYVTAEVGTKMFFPFATPVDAALRGVNSWALCFDYATGAACGDFPTDGVRTFPDVNKGRVSIYGFAADRDGCIWGLGDAGWQVSFNSTGATGDCTRTSATVSLQPKTFYCASPEAKITWTKAQLTGIELSKVTSFDVSVFDTAGVPVPGFSNLAGSAGIVDLSALPAGDGYRFDTSVLVNDASVLNTGTAEFRVTFDGPPAEICLRTELLSVCSPPPLVRNDAEAVLTDAEGSATSSSFSELNVLIPPRCTRSTTTSTPTTTTPTTAPPFTAPPTTAPTTTAPPTTAPSTTGAPTTTSPTTTVVPADVAGISQTRGTPPPGSSLALTGSNALKLLFSGLLLIAAGLLLIDLRKYRNQSS